MQLRKDGTILPRHGNHQAANDPRHPAQLIEHDAIRNNHYQPTHGPQMNSVRESPAMQVVRDGPVVNRFESDSLLADAVATLIANAVDQGVTATPVSFCQAETRRRFFCHVLWRWTCRGTR